MDNNVPSDQLKLRAFKRIRTESCVSDIQATRNYLNRIVSGLVSNAIENSAKKNQEIKIFVENQEFKNKRKNLHTRNKTEGQLYLTLFKKPSIDAFCDEVLEKAKEAENLNPEVLYEQVEHSKVELVQDDDGKKLAGYKISDYIGEGEYAKVKLVEKGREYFASKIFNDGVLKQTHQVETNDGDSVYTNPYEDFYREVAIMKLLDHPNLIKLKEVIFDKTKKKYYMIMDYCSKGEIMKFDEDLNIYFYPWKDDQEPLLDWQLEKILNHASRGLYYLHYNGITHRDIKPENLLLCDDFTLKLADFGQSHLLSDYRMSSRIMGTDYFNAPESITAEGPVDLKAADIWALGVTFYLIVFQEMPFQSENDSLFEDIMNFSLCFSEKREVSQDLKDVLTAMLEKDPQKRITAEELVKMPYINKAGIIEILTEPPICPSLSEIEEAVKPITQAMYSKF
jgi:[calcium/calmodulin-dependent protein kinase] kinase